MLPFEFIRRCARNSQQILWIFIEWNEKKWKQWTDDIYRKKHNGSRIYLYDLFYLQCVYFNIYTHKHTQKIHEKKHLITLFCTIRNGGLFVVSFVFYKKKFEKCIWHDFWLGPKLNNSIKNKVNTIWMYMFLRAFFYSCM